MTDTNNTPTLKDVDAELAPKGLPVIELNGPTWVGPWTPLENIGSSRCFLVPAPNNHMPRMLIAVVAIYAGDRWCFRSGIASKFGSDESGFRTPEAAQQACEAAIVAAWRNR
jgi:hypothetical protein